MRILIEIEIYKTIKEKYYFILILAAAILGIITVFLNESFVNARGISEITGGAALLSGIGNISVSLIFCSIFLNMHIGSDFANRTLPMTIAGGYTRREIFISKMITFVLFSVCLIIIYPMVLTIGTSIINGWGGKVSISYLLLRIILFLLVNISILSICVCLEFFINSGTVSLICNIIFIGVGTQILVGISNDIKGLKRILNLTPFSQIEYISKDMIEFSQFGRAALISFVFGFILLYFAYRVFNKKDLK